MTSMELTSWDLRFMDLARFIGTWSKDRSRKVGAVVVGTSNEIRAIGYNGFPRGIDDTVLSRHCSDSGEKYKWTEHAERNAIYNAARIGTKLEGCKIYIPWFPCMDCARAIVQTGIIEVIAITPNYNDKQWGADFIKSMELLEEAKIIVRFVECNEMLEPLTIDE
jgi:dCMP deaminase